jgi:hypothetical protein
MKAILDGIYLTYSGNAALKAALPGGLFREIAPQSASMNYAIYNAFAVPDYWMAGRMYELVSIQFDIYAATSALRDTAYGALTALYDDSKPTATGYTTILLERGYQQPLRDGENDEYFRYMIKYNGRYFK